MLENTKGTIKNEQSRETGNTHAGYTRRRKTKQNYNTICVGHHYMLTNTNNVNKTRGLLQTPEGFKSDVQLFHQLNINRTNNHLSA